ncbi:tetratricopeptide repeat protein [Sphingobacterium thalpophilum]|uniref:Flp pilus assembly protein TadD, contains TPR repeats n=2 Tax=Sphingobacterium TaxID=28453 RepID=A0A4U9UJ22_9SPHI|nr:MULTISPECIES: tetratricopeptide repeat protein [Sphingobacterium]MCW8310411.1 tetratricopeptide repeat protein [Sphingobacterium sp. InxBP1]VTR33485.1 Flp pilus assembly protein TadD, contains TPR repeats [Sphingobacterium thalpophilum]
MSKNTNNTNQGFKPSKGSFFQDNQKSVVFILGGVVVLILLYFGYQKLYLQPRAEEASNRMYKAEQLAPIDSLQNKAISGDGSFLGFKQIAEEYSNTKSANIANAYLGGLYLRQGKFDEAVKALEKYSPTGSQILDPLVIGLTGDAYSELKDYKKAADYYKQASEKSSNSYTTPLFLKKLGLVYEAQNDYKSAETAYKKIKTDFPESQEASTIDGLLGRVQAHL